MRYARFLCLLIFIILVCGALASAMIPSFTYRGTVTDLDPMGETLTIEATHRWGCTYEGEETYCSWMEIDPEEMQATVPVTNVYSAIMVGDTVEVTGLPDYSWHGIGLLIYDLESGYLATDLFGDLGYLPAPLIDGYDVVVETYPDCATCSGTVCEADYATVTVTRFGEVRWTGSLSPGEHHTYYDTRDYSSLYIKFLSGEASSIDCEDAEIILDGGPQPFSRFVVKIEPPILTPVTEGSLVVTSRPEGAFVYLNREYLGETPLIRSGIAPGIHSLLVEKEGYESWTSEISIRTLTATTVSARLYPLYGSLDVRSVPSDATVLLDGIQAGFTPCLITEVMPGTHTISISKPGYYPAEVPAYVSAGGRALIYKRLRAGAPL